MPTLNLANNLKNFLELPLEEESVHRSSALDRFVRRESLLGGVFHQGLGFLRPSLFLAAMYF